MNVYISPVSFHRNQPKVTTKVSRVLLHNRHKLRTRHQYNLERYVRTIKKITHQSRQRQSVPETCHRRLEVGALKVLINALILHCCIHIRPDEWYRTTWNTATFVRDLDGDILLTLDYDDFNRRQL
jgi:hypothetical protein